MKAMPKPARRRRRPKRRRQGQATKPNLWLYGPEVTENPYLNPEHPDESIVMIQAERLTQVKAWITESSFDIDSEDVQITPEGLLYILQIKREAKKELCQN